MGYGSHFSDAGNPQAVVMVGKPGEVGSCEISEVIFSTQGPAGGAIASLSKENRSIPASSHSSDAILFSL